MREGLKNYRGVRGHAPPENLLNSLGMNRRVRHLSFKPCLQGAPTLLSDNDCFLLAFIARNVYYQKMFYSL